MKSYGVDATQVRLSKTETKLREISYPKRTPWLSTIAAVPAAIVITVVTTAAAPAVIITRTHLKNDF